MARRRIAQALALVLAVPLIALAPVPVLRILPVLGVDHHTPQLSPVESLASQEPSQPTTAPARPANPAGASLGLDAPDPMVLDPALAARTAVAPGRLGGEETGLPTFSTIGLAVDRTITGPALVRVHTSAGWEPWRPLSPEPSEAPDPGTEGNGRVASAPMWVRGADGYQVSVTPDAAGANLEVSMVRETGATVKVEQHPAVAHAYDIPLIHTRDEWGARPSNYGYSYAPTVKLGIVHHTVSANSYSPDEVPGILRAVQAFHMDTNGWNDIAYNFAVDNFGRMWEARGGGIDRPVIGGHALNYNTASTGVVMLGDFSTAYPTPQAVDAVGTLLGWKLAITAADPYGSVWYTSYDGVTSYLPRIIGHRDVNQTGCPGNYLYPQLPRVRDVAKWWYGLYLPQYSNPVGAVDAAVLTGPTSARVQGWAWDRDAGGPIQVRVYSAGVLLATVTAGESRPDLTGDAGTYGPDHGFTVDVTGLPSGPKQLCVAAVNVGYGTTDPAIGCRAPDRSGTVAGALDDVGFGAGGLRVSGWALDFDAGGPAPVSVTVDGGAPRVVAADVDRPDLAAAYPGWGRLRGFAAGLGDLADGSHTVCVSARGVVAGDTPLGCRTVVVQGRVFGQVEQVTTVAGGVRASGWAIDPDTTGPIRVDLAVDGVVTSGFADVNRPDLVAVFPSAGPRHGFDIAASVAPGVHEVCVIGVNVGPGPGDQTLGCRSVTV